MLKKKDLLDEASYRFKRKGTSIKEGENTTNKFYNYANYRKHINTMWNIIHPNESNVSSFKETAEARRISNLYLRILKRLTLVKL